MKKLPCCISCAKSDILCYSCQERFDSGELTDLDLDIAEYMLEIEEEDPDSRLGEVNFFKSIDLQNTVILIIGKGEREIYRRIMKQMQRELELPRIQLIEKSKKTDLKNIVNDFVSPGKLLGINKIFLPTGEIEYKARILIKENEKLPMAVKTIEQLIFELTENLVRLDIQETKV
ncbi:MAG: hypothetical protein ACFFCS_01980 [Candidatus Hodarchaeota archaeon]